MSEVNQAEPRSREEWAEFTEPLRRRARFTYVMRRARKDVETDPKLTAAELEQVAQVFLDARRAAS